MENIALQICIVIGIILISMTIHEMTHAFVGYWLGDDTAKEEGRLTLNPIAHIDPFMTIILPVVLLVSGAPVFGGAKPVPFNPSKVKWGEFGAALVGIAGPVTNLLLAFLGFIALNIVGLTGVLGYILQLWIVVNLGFFLFNILPIPPLDGSRLLYYLAPETIRRGMMYVEHYGIVFIFILVLLLSPLLGAYMRAGTNFFIQSFSSLFGG